MASTGTWLSGDSLSPSFLNMRGSSALTTTGFSTNTLQAETGSTVSALGQTVMMSTLSATDVDASQISCSALSIQGSIVYLNVHGIGASAVPVIDLFRARGSWTTPTAPTANAQQLAIYGAGGYDGANWYRKGRLEWESTESWVAGSKTGTRVNINVTPTGSATAADVAAFDGSGLSVVGTSSQNSLNVRANEGALSGDDSGTAGDIAWGADSGTTYVYVCTSADSWMRAALSPF